MAPRWLDRLLGRVPLVTDWDRLQLGWVEIVGTVRALEMLEDPVEGQPCVALEYRAWPPSTMAPVGGASVVADRAFQVAAAQAVEFLLEAGGRSVLVRPQTGTDVSARHRALASRYGIYLRTEVQTIAPGDEVVVRGRVVHLTPVGGSPHRVDPHRAVIEAERIRHR